MTVNEPEFREPLEVALLLVSVRRRNHRPRQRQLPPQPTLTCFVARANKPLSKRGSTDSRQNPLSALPSWPDRSHRPAVIEHMFLNLVA